MKIKMFVLVIHGREKLLIVVDIYFENVGSSITHRPHRTKLVCLSQILGATEITKKINDFGSQRNMKTAL